MLLSELHLQFKLGVDKTDSFNSPNFLTEEIDVYLSDAQEEFLEQRAYGNNLKKQGLESTQKRVSDLQSITDTAIIAPLSNQVENKPGGLFVPLPANYRHAINEEIDVTYADCNNTQKAARIQVHALTHDKYNNMASNPFTRPSLNKAYRLPYGRFNATEHFEIIAAPGHSIVTYYLRYLRNPLKINLAQRADSTGAVFGLINPTDVGELTDEAYREVIRIAVRNALGDIESQRTQESKERLTELE